MEIKYQIILSIFIFLNGITVGNIDSSEYSDYKYYLAIALFSVFGSIFLIIGFACLFYDKLSDVFMFTFWYRWFFTKYYNDLPEEKLKNIKYSAKYHKMGEYMNFIRRFFYLLSLKLIKKRYKEFNWN